MDREGPQSSWERSSKEAEGSGLFQESAETQVAMATGTSQNHEYQGSALIPQPIAHLLCPGSSTCLHASKMGAAKRAPILRSWGLCSRGQWLWWLWWLCCRREML